MAANFSADRFRTVLRAAAHHAGLELAETALELAVTHADLLHQWNPTAGLTTLAGADEIAQRHFVESFIAAQLIPIASADRGIRLLDVGSGGGFPGLAIRIVRPDVLLTLLEPRLKKAAFLQQVARTQAPPLPVVLSLRLEDAPLDAGWDVITLRAVQVPARELLARLLPGGSILTFETEEETQLTAELRRQGLVEAGSRTIGHLPGRVVAWERGTATAT